MKKKIIIDTDPAMGTRGGDPEDCFAIMLAMNSPELEILGITTRARKCSCRERF